jgi:S-adenosylmethionine hydrolase
MERKKSVPVIALLTDFGLHDQYVAAMKGVLLSFHPTVRIVDITHDILPQKIRQAGYLLWSVYKFFPKRTIFVGIVDPGVGSTRRIIGVRTKQFTFLAPDNGLLDFVLSTEKVLEEIEVTEQDNKKYISNELSSTFHGRDVFAPLAGYLSKGIPLKRLGVSVVPHVVAPPFVQSPTDAVRPCILHIDHFGNIITNLAAKNTDQVAKDVQAISIGPNLVSRWIRFYDEAPENTPSLILGSSGLVEVSMKNKNAARLLSAELDAPVKVYWG